MRHSVRLFALSALLALPSGLFAQSVFFSVNGREQKWDINDPFAAPDAKKDPRKAVWKDKNIILDDGRGAETSRKVSTVSRLVWPNEPAPLTKAREHVERGEPEQALRLVEPVLRLFEPVRKVPGSLWLKAAAVKLDALSQLTNDAVLGAFIAVLEEADDGSVPGLAGKIKLAKLDRRVRSGDHAAVLGECDKLLGEIDEPDMQARLLVIKADALFALRRHEDALNTYLRIPVFFGSEKTFIPPAYLGAAKALLAMDTPTTHAVQRLDLAAGFYLREIIRDHPLSKEAGVARTLLPRDERAAEDNLVLNAQKNAAVTGAGDTPPAPEAKPDEPPSSEETK